MAKNSTINAGRNKKQQGISAYAQAKTNAAKSRSDGVARKAKATECYKCGLPLIFVHRNGKFHPTNPDGSDHWDICSKTRNAKSTAPRVTMKQWPVMVGENYNPKNACGCLPWEFCACGNGADIVRA